eukprot:12969098-Ditylum_brightwellii.AAC.1
MTEQITGTICLGPIGNLQGGYRFLNITTRRCIKRKQHPSLPMLADIIQQVKNMAKQQLQQDELVFTSMHGAPITSLDNNADGITGMDDFMVKDTIEQQDAPTQIVEQEEMIDS